MTPKNIKGNFDLQYTMQYELSLKYATEISHWSDKLTKERMEERGHSAEGPNKLKQEKEERLRNYNEFLRLEEK